MTDSLVILILLFFNASFGPAGIINTQGNRCLMKLTVKVIITFYKWKNSELSNIIVKEELTSTKVTFTLKKLSLIILVLRTF